MTIATFCRTTALLLCLFQVASSAFGADAAGEFVPRTVFSGYSHGDGNSKLFFKRTNVFHVESHGYSLSDGTFRLDQTTTFRGQPPTKRFWIIGNADGGEFAATLSDASGPVSGFVKGPRLVLSYRTHGIFVLHQKLELQADGKTIDNTGRITFLGIPVGWLHETIVRD